MTKVTLQWDHNPRSFELAKLEKAWAVCQEAPAGLKGMKLSVWLARELKKHPEFDEELFEGSRYAVVIETNMWRPE